MVLSGVPPIPGLFLCIYLLLTFWTVYWFFFRMDSDTAATTPPSWKIRHCSYGRRMSSLIHDFHSISVVCRELTVTQTIDVPSVQTWVTQ